jgi:hypothetical protein
MVRVHGNIHHMDLLTAQDRMDYMELQKSFADVGVQRRKGQSSGFNEMLERVQSYAIRDDGGDCKLCVVCGIFWLKNAIAVSTRQLTKLTGKCKSSINAGFNSIGFRVLPMGVEHVAELINKCPLMKNFNAEMREWSIRAKEDTTAAESVLQAAGDRVLLSDVEFDGFYDPDEYF